MARSRSAITLLLLAGTLTAGEATWTLPPLIALVEDESESEHGRIDISGLSTGTAGHLPSIFITAIDPGLLSVSNAELNAGDLTRGWLHMAPQPDAFGSTGIFLAMYDYTVSALPLLTAYVPVTIAPRPDTPRVTISAPVLAERGGSAVVGDGLTFLDPDGGDTGSMTLRLVSAPAHGIFLLDDVVWTLDASIGVQPVLDGRLRYQHDGSAATGDSFAFTCTSASGSSRAVQVPIDLAGHRRPLVRLPWSAGIWVEGVSDLAVFAAAAVEAGDAASYTHGVIRAAVVSGGEAHDLLAIAAQGGDATAVTVTAGRVSYGGTPVATASGGTGTDPLLITLDQGDTDAALVQALVRAITFANTGKDPGAEQRILALSIDDGVNGLSTPLYTAVDLRLKDDLPELPAGTRITTLAGMERTLDLGAVDPDPLSRDPRWTLVGTVPFADLALVDDRRPAIRIIPRLPGLGSVQMIIADTVSSATVSVPVEVASLAGIRPHPCAEPPRGATAGDQVEVLVPWDASDVAGAALRFSIAGTPPAGLTLTTIDATRVRVAWPVPTDALAGTRLRFLLLADAPGDGMPGILPFDVLIRPTPAGRG